jgi:hypothetical protein
VTTNKSISITGVDGAGIDTNGGGAITINSPGAGVNITISLANLLVQNVSGSGMAGAGITVGGGLGLSLKITHCTVRGFSTGIGLAFATPFLIADTVVTNNQTGIVAARSSGTLDHVVVFQNSSGVVVGRPGGLLPDVLLAHSTVTQNGIGVDLTGGAGGDQIGSAASFGDNHIRFNGTDVRGAP